ncbi:hypothetical protein TRFO_01432 [Tritrichomonas foetus]|uniref:NTF2 domain-containing protein n=1 Tax=Tritrichomonas foetus TaxID=1144522 RepID=A0A1J4JZ61_9EUKA|nr:hypothetical protein TRFO_01432 [Tritrichomonas foetus]|eukprot:OHT03776.1 hypothetical protein TRFO_01432 [Tritrichomonas foetus]
MNEHLTVVPQFVKAYYTTAFTDSLSLHNFYDKNAFQSRNNKTLHIGKPINPKMNIFPISKKSELHIVNYVSFPVGQENIALSVCGNIKTEKVVFGFSQNFILKKVEERYFIVSDVYFDFRESPPISMKTIQPTAQQQRPKEDQQQNQTQNTLQLDNSQKKNKKKQNQQHTAKKNELQKNELQKNELQKNELQKNELQKNESQKNESQKNESQKNESQKNKSSIQKLKNFSNDKFIYRPLNNNTPKEENKPLTHIKKQQTSRNETNSGTKNDVKSKKQTNFNANPQLFYCPSDSNKIEKENKESTENNPKQPSKESNPQKTATSNLFSKTSSQNNQKKNSNNNNANNKFVYTPNNKH